MSRMYINDEDIIRTKAIFTKLKEDVDKHFDELLVEHDEKDPYAVNIFWKKDHKFFMKEDINITHKTISVALRWYRTGYIVAKNEVKDVLLSLIK